MRTSGGRVALVVLLLLVGLAAALRAWESVRAVKGLDAGAEDVSRGLDRLGNAVRDVALAQEAYVAPGNSAATAFSRAAAAFQRIPTEMAALQTRLRSADGVRLQDMANSTDALLDVDARARTALRFGDPITASDLVFGEGHDLVVSMLTTVNEVRAAELSTFLETRADRERRGVRAVAAGAALWAIGLLVLAYLPAPRETAATTALDPADPSPADVLIASEDGDASAGGVDLAAAADLCTRISRVTSAAALDDLLARAAGILDASGIIIWMGAGDELFAATAYGYDARIISRLGPIPRAAENATAAAWRTGETRIVASDVGSSGAIVAPMFGPDTCIGVLAAEVRHGLEGDPTAQAVAAMFAAQLATLVSAWPAGSTAEDTTKG